MEERPPLGEQEVGVVTHYWNHLGVAGVTLTRSLDVGDHIHVLGHTSDFEQDVDSMEIDHHRVQHANAGDRIGLRVAEHAREHDHVYRTVTPDDTALWGMEL